MRQYLGLAGAEVRETFLQVLDEIPPECYQPPNELNDPPGCPFIFLSGVLGRDFFSNLRSPARRRSRGSFSRLASSPVLNRARKTMKCFQCEKGKMVSQPAELTACVRGEIRTRLGMNFQTIAGYFSRSA